MHINSWILSFLIGIFTPFDSVLIVSRKWTCSLFPVLVIGILTINESLDGGRVARDITYSSHIYLLFFIVDLFFLILILGFCMKIIDEIKLLLLRFFDGKRRKLNHFDSEIDVIWQRWSGFIAPPSESEMTPFRSVGPVRVITMNCESIRDGDRGGVPAPSVGRIVN